jgi:hypothetical protein
VPALFTMKISLSVAPDAADSSGLNDVLPGAAVE